MKALFTSISLLFLSLSLNAQISIVKNIKSGSGGSTPYPFTTLANGNLLFLADDGVSGYELWTSDGTTPNTSMLVDMNPGATGSFSTFSNVLLNGKIYFTASDGTHGNEPWITDGTVAGTSMIKDINAGSAGSCGAGTGDNFVVLNGKVYFAANDATNGKELWVTDGTASGTQIVKNINPGSASSAPTCLQVAFGKVFFVANDGTHGSEWWYSDGTTSGTAMLTDLYVGVGDGLTAPNNPFFVFNGMAYFSGTAGAAMGNELYSTDGSTVSLVKDINSGAPGSNPTNFTVAGGKLYFAATESASGQELYMTDGTPSGTVLVKNIESGASSSNPSLIGELNGKLLFNATTTAQGTELWTSDGTTIGTTMLLDINTGAGNGTTTIVSEIYGRPGYNLINNNPIYNGKYYFTANDGTNGQEFWISDGTAAGTAMVPGQIGVNPSTTASAAIDWILIANNAAWIRGNDGNSGAELFRYPISTVSVPKLSANEFAVYPTPNNGNFRVRLNNFDAAVTNTLGVYDVMGRLVHSQNLTGTITQVQTNNLPKGMYVLKLQQGDAVSVNKVTVQ